MFGDLEEKVWTVYVHINKINNKCYVGITRKDPEKRWNNGWGYKTQPFFNAIQKYGWDNFDHEIVASNLTQSEAENFERILIEKLDSFISNNGYNAAFGGLGGCKWEEIRPVYQFNCYGDLLNEYKCIADAEKATGANSPNIIACCQGKVSHAKGFVWRYKDDVDDLQKFKESIDWSALDACWSIYQFDMNQNFIAEYNCARDATLVNSKWLSHSVLNVCRGKYKHSCGYIWRFKKDIPDIEAFKNEHIDFSQKPTKCEHVLQFDLDGNFIQEFDSARDASKYYDCDSHTITYACSGRTKTGIGYLWMWKRDYNGESPVYVPDKKCTRPVLQFDLNGNFIARYESIVEAAKTIGRSTSCVKDACNGRQKTCANFIWKYGDEIDLMC